MFDTNFYFCSRIAECANIAKFPDIAEICWQKTFGDIGVPPPVIDFTMLFSFVEQVKNPENQINIEGAPALLMFLVLLLDAS